jgi:hypothetical protein
MQKALAYYLLRGKESLLARRETVNAFVRETGISLLGDSVEVGTGRKEWPVLKDLIAQVKARKAVLVIAHLGRLKRSPSFLRLLSDTQVPFLCCDEPHLSERNVHVLLLEASNRSQHFREARLTTKQRVTGFPNRMTDSRFLRGVQKGAEHSASLRAARSAKQYAPMLPLMQQFRAMGQTYDQVALSLNANGHLTTLGTPFNGPTVYRIMQRAGCL